MSLLFYVHPSVFDHDTGPGHPERPQRIRAILDHLDEQPVPGLLHRVPRPAEIAWIERAHPRRHVERVFAAMEADGLRHLDPDTVVSPTSREATLRAAGAAVDAVDAVLGGKASRAFSAMRPPGHHAEPERAMGFCLFNNIAIGALHARHGHGIRRIAIFDFDVHHGNGTQAIFWNDPQTLYASTHQWPLYPGTGRDSETGVAGNILNRTFPPGTGSAEWRRVVARDMVPRIEAFAPELVMISAGFDAHRDDPLASLQLVEEDFAWITGELVRIAGQHAAGRLVSLLEGGYNLAALARSVRAHLVALGAAS